MNPHLASCQLAADTIAFQLFDGQKAGAMVLLGREM